MFLHVLDALKSIRELNVCESVWACYIIIRWMSVFPVSRILLFMYVSIWVFCKYLHIKIFTLCLYLPLFHTLGLLAQLGAFKICSFFATCKYMYTNELPHIRTKEHPFEKIKHNNGYNNTNLKLIFIYSWMYVCVCH